MRVKTGIAVGMLAILLGAGCYPHDCKPNDTSCLPCPDPANTNPSCPPFPQDLKSPDGGSK